MTGDACSENCLGRVTSISVVARYGGMQDASVLESSLVSPVLTNDGCCQAIPGSLVGKLRKELLTLAKAVHLSGVCPQTDGSTATQKRINIQRVSRC